MTFIRSSMLASAAALTLAITGAACERTSQGAREDAAEMQQKADQAATEARDMAREGARDAQRTASETAGRLDAAGETFSIKTALIAAKTVDASDINVDTFADTRTVVLRGTVPTLEQKKQAEQIATREAAGFRIDNQLTIRSRPQ